MKRIVELIMLICLITSTFFVADKNIRADDGESTPAVIKLADVDTNQPIASVQFEIKKADSLGNVETEIVETDADGIATTTLLFGPKDIIQVHQLNEADDYRRLTVEEAAKMVTNRIEHVGETYSHNPIPLMRGRGDYSEKLIRFLKDDSIFMDSFNNREIVLQMIDNKQSGQDFYRWIYPNKLNIGKDLTFGDDYPVCAYRNNIKEIEHRHGWMAVTSSNFHADNMTVKTSYGIQGLEEYLNSGKSNLEFLYDATTFEYFILSSGLLSLSYNNLTNIQLQDGFSYKFFYNQLVSPVVDLDTNQILVFNKNKNNVEEKRCPTCRIENDTSDFINDSDPIGTAGFPARIEKRDIDTQQPIAGAVFEVTKISEGVIRKERVTTKEDGIAVTNLVFKKGDTIKIHEVNTPKGYRRLDLYETSEMLFDRLYDNAITYAFNPIPLMGQRTHLSEELLNGLANDEAFMDKFYNNEIELVRIQDDDNTHFTNNYSQSDIAHISYEQYQVLWASPIAQSYPYSDFKKHTTYDAKGNVIIKNLDSNTFVDKDGNYVDGVYFVGIPVLLEDFNKINGITDENTSINFWKQYYAFFFDDDPSGFGSLALNDLLAIQLADGFSKIYFNLVLSGPLQNIEDGNILYYGKKLEEDYIVKYDTEGYKTIEDRKDLSYYADDLTSGINPEIEGKTFDGWYIDKDRTIRYNGESFNELSNDCNNKEIVLYAKYVEVAKYRYVEGMDQTYVLGSKKDLEGFVIKRSIDDDKAFSYFVELEINKGSKYWTPEYDASKGSVRHNLKATFLETLAPGTYTVTAYFKDDGKAVTTFTVVEKKHTDKPSTTPKIPRTGVE